MHTDYNFRLGKGDLEHMERKKNYFHKEGIYLYFSKLKKRITHTPLIILESCE